MGKEENMTSTDVFWGYIGTYNEAIFPMQIITIIAAVVLTCFLFVKPGSAINKLMKAYLSFTYAWIGIVFFIIMVPSSLEPGFPIFGILFVIIALLFAIDIFAGKIVFELPRAKGKRYFTLFLVLAAFILFPLIEWSIGHRYPLTPLFGVLPCPTNIFSIALLAGAVPRVDRKVFSLLLIPAMRAGISGPLQHGAYGDVILLVAGIYGLIVLIKNWKVIGEEGSKK
jgi:hypothetical protein